MPGGGHQRAVDGMGKHLFDQLPRRRSAQLYRQLGPLRVQLCQRARQARCSGALHGAQPQATAGLVGMQGLAGLFGQRQQPVGVPAQGFARRREHHAPPLAQKKRDPQLFFELLHAGGHVRLHAAQSLGGARDAAFPGNSAKNFQRGEVHERSLYEMI